MRRRPPSRPGPALAAAVALAAGWLASCAQEDLSAHDDAFCQKALNDPESVDAFDWLKDPYGGPKRLGAWSTDQGLALAHELQARGAKRVVAVGVRRSTGPDAHQSAEGLVVALPEDPVRRRALFELYARQVRSEGYTPEPDRGQTYLFLAWAK